MPRFIYIVATCLSVGALVLAAREDLRSRTIPNGCSVALLCARMLLIVGEFLEKGLAPVPGLFAESVLGLVLVFASLVLPLLILFPHSETPALGGGDVKLLSAVGALVGWKRGLIAVALTSLLGAAVGTIAYVLEYARHQNPTQRLGKRSVALAPAIALAGLFVLSV